MTWPNPFSFPSQRDLAALEKKVKVLSEETARLSKTYPESATRVQVKEREVTSTWQALVAKSQARASKLVQAEQLQRYLSNFRDLRYSS